MAINTKDGSPFFSRLVARSIIDSPSKAESLPSVGQRDFRSDERDRGELLKWRELLEGILHARCRREYQILIKCCQRTRLRSVVFS